MQRKNQWSDFLEQWNVYCLISGYIVWKNEERLKSENSKWMTKFVQETNRRLWRKKKRNFKWMHDWIDGNGISSEREKDCLRSAMNEKDDDVLETICCERIGAWIKVGGTIKVCDRTFAIVDHAPKERKEMAIE